ncbi:MAG: hypothetical protein IT410_00810 [Candidatus Doudnabacteria bacterium]|nr:hypothetical protein [Candidatus Doudnabacteria bacterium]
MPVPVVLSPVFQRIYRHKCVFKIALATTFTLVGLIFTTVDADPPPKEVHASAELWGSDQPSSLNPEVMPDIRASNGSVMPIRQFLVLWNQLFKLIVMFAAKRNQQHAQW